jgi:hypothetical protein
MEFYKVWPELKNPVSSLLGYVNAFKHMRSGLIGRIFQRRRPSGVFSRRDK